MLLIDKAVRKDFIFLREKVIAVLIFGSAARMDMTQRSDIDICVVAPKQNTKSLLKEIFRHVDVRGKNYDVRIFEELPLYLKMEVIDNHRIIFGNKDSMYEYFYSVRKLWKDQKRRQVA